MAHPFIALGTLALTAVGGTGALVATAGSPPAPSPWTASTPGYASDPEPGTGGGATWYGRDDTDPGLVHTRDAKPPAKAKPTTKAPKKATAKTAPARPRWIGRTSCPTVHTVKGVRVVTVRSGDSAWHIARCNHVDLVDLAEANRLPRGGALVRVGQQLAIPEVAK